MEWISVESEKPEFEKKVNVKLDDGTETIGYINDNWQRTCWLIKCDDGLFWRSFTKTVTHWMPLPEPPKTN